MRTNSRINRANLKVLQKKYEVDKLGYYEIFDNIVQAIEREKQIKAGSRKNKLKLIERFHVIARAKVRSNPAFINFNDWKSIEFYTYL